MSLLELLSDPLSFSEALYEKMKLLSPGIHELDLYEFRYGMIEFVPDKGWDSIVLDECDVIVERITNRSYYDGIQVKPGSGERIALDSEIVHLTRMLFVGLVAGKYPLEWVGEHFYFDIRGFFFLHRTVYFTDEVMAHFGGMPYRRFEQKQRKFEYCQDIGYKAFREANEDVDQLFIDSVMNLIAVRGTPILLAIAGATAAGKTEIVERMTDAFRKVGRKVASIELDNFFTDRDYREAQGIDSRGKEAYHFKLFKQSLEDITRGTRISIPQYNTIDATSSHDLEGNLKPGRSPIEIEPADIILVEGNFPFLIDEVIHLMGIKVVYFTDDPIRLKRKWKRDIDYRKKYDLNYFRNRYFKDQFIMAQFAYIPQLTTCDMAVDTTGAALWTTPEIAKILEQG